MKRISKLVMPLVLLMISLLIQAQVSDDFSDGNFFADPLWTGDIDDFKVNSLLMLQLDAEEAGTSSLRTVNIMADSLEWIFRIKLSFSPSANNNARVYLLSDSEDMGIPLNGYFLQFGEAGTGDAIELFRQDGGGEYSICRGSDGFLASSFDLVIKVSRNSSNEWNIFTKIPGAFIFSHQASGSDTLSPVPTGYFGIVCKYTSSNATKFYFDDFVIRHIYKDTIPPELNELQVSTPSSLDLVFSEALDSSSVTNLQNYIVTNNFGFPAGLVFNPGLPWKVQLLFNDSFLSGKYYKLNITGIEDIYGNLISPGEVSFVYYKPQPYDVVINEIMADISPAPAGLPPCEFVEIYNRAGFTVNLNHWALLLGNSIKTIEETEIPPNSYHILTKEGCVFGGNVSQTTFSSFNITNTGQNIVLKESDGSIQSALAYTPGLYDNDIRGEGGWSLERIDPSNPCGETGNWNPSSDPDGGTPGRKNSADGINPDNTNPVLRRIGIIDSTHIRVYFTESMLVEDLENTDRYLIEPGHCHPNEVKAVEPLCRAVDLRLPYNMDPGILYTLKTTNDFSDCAGNKNIISAELPFQLPVNIYPKGLIINEVLFNPMADGVDFIEIFNPSDDVFDLKDIRISSFDYDAMKIKDLHYTGRESYLILPGDYVVLTTHGRKVQNQYYRSSPMAFPEDLTSFPALGNDEGSVAISDYYGILIDTFYYKDDMHYSLLTNTDGVSLERISPLMPTNNPSNWHSAGSNAGYASPGLENSQHENLMVVHGSLEIDPKAFSPDNDGNDDVLSIGYMIAEPGFLGNLMIFSDYGKMVRYLVNNQLLATDGTFFWDGRDDNNKSLPKGFYIILLEIHDLEGRRKKFKRVTIII